MNSVDLFSGIGGISYALSGIVRPIAYCEIDPFCQSVLQRNMQLNRLPRAPVFQDVRTLTRKNLGRSKVDIITAGFPCIGFSNLGNKQGFENPQSSLFSEVVRLVDELHPSFVFMENVPRILDLGMKDIIVEFTRRGYDLSWCVCSAQQVGALHVRRRWFCLAYKPEKAVKASLSGLTDYKPFANQWKRHATTAPPRMSIQDVKLHKERDATLGNAVVPDAVRQAFVHLFTAGHATLASKALKQLVFDSTVNDQTCEAWTSSRFPKSGNVHHTAPKHVCTFPMTPAIFEAPRLSVSFNDTYYNTRPIHQSASPMLTTAILKPKQDVVYKSWSTPRHGMTGACNFLTARSIKDLPSQVRFEKDTPDEIRRGVLSGDFVDWLMGYPTGWTHPNAKK